MKVTQARLLALGAFDGPAASRPTWAPLVALLVACGFLVLGSGFALWHPPHTHEPATPAPEMETPHSVNSYAEAASFYRAWGRGGRR